MIHRGRGDDDIVIVQAVQVSGPVKRAADLAGLAERDGFWITGRTGCHGQQEVQLRIGTMTAKAVRAIVAVQFTEVTATGDRCTGHQQREPAILPRGAVEQSPAHWVAGDHESRASRLERALHRDNRHAGGDRRQHCTELRGGKHCQRKLDAVVQCDQEAVAFAYTHRSQQAAQAPCEICNLGVTQRAVAEDDSRLVGCVRRMREKKIDDVHDCAARRSVPKGCTADGRSKFGRSWSPSARQSRGLMSGWRSATAYTRTFDCTKGSK